MVYTKGKVNLVNAATVINTTIKTNQKGSNYINSRTQVEVMNHEVIFIARKIVSGTAENLVLIGVKWNMNAF